ncbi:MAG: peptidylprolyl isomerase [Cetobacterium sp.]|uniref:peptidylprolyl isomerase n=1 Tax=Cetobacterium sp. TaxID=2071632 RepID=UPI003F3FF734
MAIRKFRKNMKPVIWVITIFFLISLIAGYAMSFRSSSANTQLAFKLNGKKVTMVEAHRSMAIMSENYKRYLGTNIDSELMNTIAFNELINRNLLLEMADKLKVKVSGSEVSAQMDQIKAAFPDKEQFKSALLSQGYTTKTLENEIRENLILQKTAEAITQGVQVTSEEIDEYYADYKYSMFQGKPLEEVKTQIEQALKMQKGAEAYAKNMSEARAKMKLEDLDKNFDAYVEKEEFEFDGVKVSNVEFDKRLLNTLVMTKGDLEQAKELAKSSVESEIKLLKASEAKGIKVDSVLPLDLQVANAVKELYSKLKSEVTYTQNDLREFFEENQLNYDTLESADANVAILKVQPTESDDQKAKEKAEDLLKKVNKNNFAEMAKNFSDGPSGPTGGALGTFKKGDMVKPFEDAAFTGVPGKVYPEVVKTQFGYHIIFVQEKDDKAETVTASHILIIPEPSEETVTLKNTQIAQIVKDLTDKTITFEDLKNDKDIVFSEKIDGITKEGYIPGLGYNEELAKAIYDSKVGDVGFIKDQKDFIIYKKDSQTDEKKADFQEFENQVKTDYINTKAQEALKEIELSTQNTEN